MAKEIDFVSGNPCAEIQTVTVSGGGSYTITLPTSTTPKGTVVVLDDAPGQMVFDGNKWLSVTPRTDDVTKYTDVELRETMADIESLFKLCDDMGFDGPWGDLTTLPPKAIEYNRCEEELIRRADLPKYNLEVNLDGLSMEPGSPARIMIDAVAEQIRSVLDGYETGTP